MKLISTLIKNYVHCKRQAYLYYYGLNFWNDLVRIGKIMHEEQELEKEKIDGIKGEFLINLLTLCNLQLNKF